MWQPATTARDNNAGTNGYGTITAPGNDPYVITVGAMNTEGTADRSGDVIATYSSKGPSLVDQVVKPDIVAPGNLIDSLYFASATLNQENPGYEVPLSLYVNNASANSSAYYYALSGTSMATPMVSGAAALMLQQNPNLTPDQVKATLMLTAFKDLVQTAVVTDPSIGQSFNEQADIFTVGAGLLDIQAALANTQLAPATVGSAMSPTAAVDANGNVILQANGSSVLGGNSVLWGTSVCAGTSVSLGYRPTPVNLYFGAPVRWQATACCGAPRTLGHLGGRSRQRVVGHPVLGGTSVLWGTDTPLPDQPAVAKHGAPFPGHGDREARTDGNHLKSRMHRSTDSFCPARASRQ